ncbi:hypothetical protein NXX36_17240 [Bacteroides fragilis]|nr:hypothetical protein [Bacteroides fragilis]
MYKLYLPQGDVDVAMLYDDIIRRAVRQAGEEIVDVCSLKDIKRGDKVIAVCVRDAFAVWLRNPAQYVIVWTQGIVEEILTQTIHCPFITRMKYLCFCFLEYLVLKKAKRLFFVSEAMRKHFIKKYGSFKTPYIIMPCFNIEQLDIGAFYPEKYANPTFVYAGGFQKWQCVDRMLLVFKEIQKLIPKAQLTILSKDLNLAESSIRKFGLNHVEVKYVEVEKLDREMRKYKYGFLLRDNTLVNRVATPTKMGNYLAAGIIPIFTTAVADFSNLLSLDEYGLRFDYADSNLSIAKQIADFDQKEIDIDEIRKKYEAVFSSYYSSNHYLNVIREKNIF